MWRWLTSVLGNGPPTAQEEGVPQNINPHGRREVLCGKSRESLDELLSRTTTLYDGYYLTDIWNDSGGWFLDQRTPVYGKEDEVDPSLRTFKACGPCVSGVYSGAGTNPTVVRSSGLRAHLAGKLFNLALGLVAFLPIVWFFLVLPFLLSTPSFVEMENRGVAVAAAVALCGAPVICCFFRPSISQLFAVLSLSAPSIYWGITLVLGLPKPGAWVVRYLAILLSVFIYPLLTLVSGVFAGDDGVTRPDRGPISTCEAVLGHLWHPLKLGKGTLRTTSNGSRVLTCTTLTGRRHDIGDVGAEHNSWLSFALVVARDSGVLPEDFAFGTSYEHQGASVDVVAKGRHSITVDYTLPPRSLAAVGGVVAYRDGNGSLRSSLGNRFAVTGGSLESCKAAETRVAESITLVDAHGLYMESGPPAEAGWSDTLLMVVGALGTFAVSTGLFTRRLPMSAATLFISNLVGELLSSTVVHLFGPHDAGQPLLRMLDPFHFCLGWGPAFRDGSAVILALEGLSACLGVVAGLVLLAVDIGSWEPLAAVGAYLSFLLATSGAAGWRAAALVGYTTELVVEFVVLVHVANGPDWLLFSAALAALESVQLVGIGLLMFLPVLARHGSEGLVGPLEVWVQGKEWAATLGIARFPGSPMPARLPRFLMNNGFEGPMSFSSGPGGSSCAYHTERGVGRVGTTVFVPPGAAAFSGFSGSCTATSSEGLAFCPIIVSEGFFPVLGGHVVASTSNSDGGPAVYSVATGTNILSQTAKLGAEGN